MLANCLAALPTWLEALLRSLESAFDEVFSAFSTALCISSGACDGSGKDFLIAASHSALAMDAAVWAGGIGACAEVAALAS